MRDQFNQWRGKAKTGSMHVGRWIRRHTVLAAASLAPDSAHFAEAHPRTGSESVLRNPGSRSGNDQQHVGQRDWRRSTGDQHGPVGYQ
jgi:hypothetical protein